MTIPEAFLDELTCHIMSDPVELPISRRVVDKSTIIRHLHQHPTDPFNRQPLNLEQVVPLDALRQDIEAFLSRHINASLSTAETSATARASSHTQVTQSMDSFASACGDDEVSASEATHSSQRSSQQLQHSSEPRDTCGATDTDASDAQDVSETGGRRLDRPSQYSIIPNIGILNHDPSLPALNHTQRLHEPPSSTPPPIPNTTAAVSMFSQAASLLRDWSQTKPS